MKRRVHLAQVSHRYGDNVFLPFSVGRLWSYARTCPEIADAFELDGFSYLREPIGDAVDRIGQNGAPDVFGASCYIWNWNYTAALCEAVREAYPDCLIVAGGPHVPRVAETLPFADVLVHGEGELSFAEVLRRRAAGEDLRGLSLSGERVTDLSVLPSPYLDGTFDDLVRLPFEWNATHEGVRGCPYQCRFCDWGSAVFAKVTKFPVEIIKAEVEWMGRNRVPFMFSADANFGVVKHDLEVAKTLADVKARYGYPLKYRACYAKVHTPRLQEIAEILTDAGMNKGTTLAVQSMNEDALEAVARRNIAISDIAALSRKYQARGVVTYTELILGLPGETYDSWADGFETLMEAGQHDGINVYVCMMLPNSEMNKAEYRREHGLRTVAIPMLLTHGVPEDDPHQEMYEIVVETATMPLADWRRAYVYAWAVQVFHTMGLLRLEAMRWPGGYRDFYERVVEAGRRHPDTMLGREIMWLDGVLDSVLAGGGWDVILPEAGDVMWPPEEASFLRLVRDLPRVYDEVEANAGIAVGADQRDAVVTPDGWASFQDYAREVVWYGRKGGAFLKPRMAEAA